MNHKNGFNPLSRTTAHRRAMSRNMVTSLFRYERITTTKAKALEVRKAAEKLITRSKVDTVHNRRQAARYIQDETVLAKLFTDIGPRMKERAGGYTRVVKLGFRQGDAADMVILELVDYKLDSGEKTEKKDTKKAKTSAEKKVSTEKNTSGEKKTASEKKSASEKKAPAKKASTAKSKAKAEAPAEESAEKASE